VTTVPIRSEVLDIAHVEYGEGSARPVILLHGWPDAARGWHEIANILGRSGRRVIVPDNRGGGSHQVLVVADTP